MKRERKEAASARKITSKHTPHEPCTAGPRLKCNQKPCLIDISRPDEIFYHHHLPSPLWCIDKRYGCDKAIRFKTGDVCAQAVSRVRKYLTVLYVRPQSGA